MKALSVTLVLCACLGVSGLSCPFFSCGTVPAGACAQKMSSQWIQLSTTPCAEGSFCSAQRMYEDWWWYAYTAVDNTYPCLALSTYEHISFAEADVYTEWPCLQRLPGKDLVEGSNPKDCASNHDCLLEDGTYGMCLCGVRIANTNGICSPDMSSSLFSNFWADCNSQGFIPDRDMGFYYSVLQRVYHLVQSDVTCAPQLLWEFMILQEAQLSMQSGAEAGVLLPLLVLVVSALA